MFYILSFLHHLPYVLFFFFNDTATTEIYTLSLHDALPISGRRPAHLPLPRFALDCDKAAEADATARRKRRAAYLRRRTAREIPAAAARAGMRDAALQARWPIGLV